MTKHQASIILIFLAISYTLLTVIAVFFAAYHIGLGLSLFKTELIIPIIAPIGCIWSVVTMRCNK